MIMTNRTEYEVTSCTERTGDMPKIQGTRSRIEHEASSAMLFMMNTALITGASGGLGEEFARLCAADGNDLVLVARSKEKLEALGKELEGKHRIRVTVLSHDLSLPDAVRKLTLELKEKNIEVEILINNAGFGAYGLFHTTSYDQEKNLIAVNIAALTELTKSLVPMMVKRGSGKILDIASTAAFQPGPLMAVYYASKAYVMHFSLALSEELKGTGVTVTCLCPGPTKTGFEVNANLENSRLFRLGSMDAATVATIGYSAMKSGRPLIVAGLRNRIGAFMTRLVPKILAAKIAKSVQSPKSQQ